MPRPGQMPDMLFEMNVPPWSPKSPVKLAEINPAFGDATANGIVSLGGAARLEAGKLTTGVQLLLENGSFQWPELKLDAENIRLDLRFNDLLGMNTPGGQSFPDRPPPLRRPRFRQCDHSLRYRLEGTG